MKTWKMSSRGIMTQTKNNDKGQGSQLTFSRKRINVSKGEGVSSSEPDCSQEQILSEDSDIGAFSS